VAGDLENGGFMRRKGIVLVSATVLAFGMAPSAGAAPNPSASGAAIVSQALAQAGVAGQARRDLANSAVGAVGAQLKLISKT
jgi:hypothetical protein